MHDVGKWIVSGLGAAALIASVFSDAMASHPAAHHVASPSHVSIKGNTSISGTLKVSGNINVKNNSYFRGKAEVDNGLLVKNGLKTDDFAATSGTVSGNLNAGTLSAGSLSGTSLAIQAGATVGGTLAVTGALSSNGLNAGSGAIATTGNLSAAGGSFSTLTDTGSLAAGSITGTTGTFTNGLTVNGTVDFSHANVTGLSQGSSFSTLTVGTLSSNTPVLTVVGNGRSTSLSVDQNGNLALGSVTTSGNLGVGGNLAVAGNLTVSGTTNFSVSSLTAPNAVNTTTPGPFTLTGNPINLNGAVNASSTLTVAGATTLNGNTTLNNADLTLPLNTPANQTPTSSHIVAGVNKDVAGMITFTIPSGTNVGVDIATLGSTPILPVTFTRPYATAPYVVVSPANDPAPNSTSSAPKYWVTSSTTGFQLHYVTAASATSAVGPISFYYHVIG